MEYEIGEKVFIPKCSSNSDFKHNEIHGSFHELNSSVEGIILERDGDRYLVEIPGNGVINGGKVDFLRLGYMKDSLQKIKIEELKYEIW